MLTYQPLLAHDYTRDWTEAKHKIKSMETDLSSHSEVDEDPLVLRLLRGAPGTTSALVEPRKLDRAIGIVRSAKTFNII